MLVGQSQDIPDIQSLNNLKVIANIMSNVGDFVGKSESDVVVNETVSIHVFTMLNVPIHYIVYIHIILMHYMYNVMYMLADSGVCCSDTEYTTAMDTHCN